ncbi:hypothetical protein C730_06435 [Helicobacter pylori Rif2]|nr:hypothetical protein C730_06435 [Helicobacter pylori Rif2]
MLNIGCKSVKSVFKIQLKAFKGNAKKQKMTQFFQNDKKKRLYAIIPQIHSNSKCVLMQMHSNV